MTRRKFPPKFKTQVVLEALNERMSMAELAQKFELHEAFIELELGSGRYASASEVIRAGLRKPEGDRKLKSLLDEALVIGEENGEPVEFDLHSFRKKLTTKYAG